MLPLPNTIPAQPPSTSVGNFMPSYYTFYYEVTKKFYLHTFSFAYLISYHQVEKLMGWGKDREAINLRYGLFHGLQGNTLCHHGPPLRGLQGDFCTSTLSFLHRPWGMQGSFSHIFIYSLCLCSVFCPFWNQFSPRHHQLGCWAQPWPEVSAGVGQKWLCPAWGQPLLTEAPSGPATKTPTQTPHTEA